MLYHWFASYKQSPLDFSNLLTRDSYSYYCISKSYNQWGSPITSGLLGS